MGPHAGQHNDQCRRHVCRRWQVLTVKYTDGQKKVTVPPDTPVVRYVPGNANDVKPGAQIFIVAGKKMPDGTIEAPALSVGRDGVAPPM
jgi:D-lyxose ketol-isomerase